LTGELDGVTDADGLAVPELIVLFFAEAGVGVVLKVRHCVRELGLRLSGKWRGTDFTIGDLFTST
jgi:hypothetical protein